jgi:hypothetical protein
MILSCSFLTDVASVNAFQENPVFFMSEGDQVDVYLQLRDIAVNPPHAGYKPPGRRYIPASGASLKVYLDNSFDNSKVVTKQCSQPFADDRSLWKFTVLATDAIRGTRNVRLELTEGTVKRGIVQSALRVMPTSEMTGSMGPSPSDFFST